jgi:hypothetical protein
MLRLAPIRYSAVVVTFLASIVSALGCGDGRPDRVPVSGRVVIDGKPLAFGNLMFVPPEGRASYGSLDSDGRFALSCFEPGDGAVVGSHKVAVIATERLGPQRMRWHAPRKLADIRTSGLTETVSGPTDDMVINLSWDGERESIEIIDDGGDEVRPKSRKPE